MSYEFKPLSGVEFTESVGENANMLVVDSGVVKQAPAASGGGCTIFYSWNNRLYKDISGDEWARKEDVEAAFKSGPMYVCSPEDGENEQLYKLVFKIDLYGSYARLFILESSDGVVEYSPAYSQEYFEDEGEG